MSTTQQAIQTAAELGLMRGFPPNSAGLVTHANLAAEGAQDAQ